MVAGKRFAAWRLLQKMTISRARSAGLAGDTAPCSGAASALPRNSRKSWSSCAAGTAMGSHA